MNSPGVPFDDELKETVSDTKFFVLENREESTIVSHLENKDS